MSRLVTCFALLSAFGWMSSVGCEARVDEPRPPPRAASDAAPVEPPSSAVAEEATGRCIRPSPPSPARTFDGPVPAPGCPEDDLPSYELGFGVVRFPGIVTDGGTLEVAVEIARKNEERMKGLMFRKNMSENAGMLFIFEEERELGFWMKNTCIPLDMIFVASDGMIVGIEENTPTLSRETFSPGCPARYVLEVNAGWSRRHGVKAGMHLSLPSS